MSDAVEHPRHYNAHPSSVEAIEICESLSFCLGNAVKYLFRHDAKGAPVEDLRKAAWYLLRAHAGTADYSSPSHDKLDRVLAHEPEGNVLGDVLRALFVNRAETNFWGAVSVALKRVEQEIEVRGGA